MQADTAEGAFASPISTSEEVSSQKTDQSPPTAPASSLSQSLTSECPLPFGSPSAPATGTGAAGNALPDDGAANQLIAEMQTVPAHKVAAETASPSVSENAAAALLLDLSDAPSASDAVSVCAADKQSDKTITTALLHHDEVDEALPVTASEQASVKPDQSLMPPSQTAADSVQPAAQASTPTDSQQPAVTVIQYNEETGAPRMSSARPQSAPSALHQQRLPSVDLDELAARVSTPVPSRSQSEEPQQVWHSLTL